VTKRASPGSSPRRSRSGLLPCVGFGSDSTSHELAFAWDSHEAEIATAQQADKWRQEAARSTEHSVESVAVLEVAVELTPSGSGPDVDGTVV
jgi:hypothetical protein